MRAPGDRDVARPPPRRLRRRARLTRRGGDVLAAGLGEVAGEQPQQLLEVAVERRVRRHLDAEVLEDGDARARAAMRRAVARTSVLGRHRRSPQYSATATARERRDDLVEPVRVLGEPGAVEEILLRRSRRASAASTRRRCPGRTWRWKSASSAVSVRRGSMTISERGGIAGDLLQRRCGRAGCRATATGSCRRRGRPRRARSRRADVGAEHAGRSPRTRRSSPGRARSSGTDAERGAASRRRTRRRGGSPARRRRSRRSSRRRGRRARRRAARRPRGWRCPSRSPRRCRRAGGAAGSSGGRAPFW